MSKRHRRAIARHLTVVLMHLLKWQYQPARRVYVGSWQRTIRTKRHQLALALEEHPSLRAAVGAFLPERYAGARAKALEETGLAEAVLPLTCPWTLGQVLDDTFWPEAQPGSVGILSAPDADETSALPATTLPGAALPRPLARQTSWPRCARAWPLKPLACLPPSMCGRTVTSTRPP